ncbi:MAG: hypothetical protein GYB50_03800 [Rhodobacteraceae bacterium]|nr:hypothetical protein [Paracoccaceae bacterium]
MSTEDLEARVARLEAELPKMIPQAALDIFARDPHRFSDRPCATCQNITTIIGRPWGCVASARRNRVKIPGAK